MSISVRHVAEGITWIRIIVMSTGYQNRKKTIKRLRKEYQTENLDMVKFYANPINDTWCGMAARLALKDRGI